MDDTDKATVRPLKPDEVDDIIQKAMTKWHQKDRQDTTKPEAAMKAPAAQGMIDTLDSFKIPGLNVALPFGSALIGGGVSLIVGNVIDATIPPRTDAAGKAVDAPLGKVNWLNVGVTGGGAGALLAWGPNLMGRGPSRFAAGLLLLRLALRIPGVADFIDNITTTLSPTPVTEAQQAAHTWNAVAQAEQVIYGHDYFRDAL